MTRTTRYLFALMAGSALIFGACEKFLDEKPRVTLALPTTLKHAQALIDNDNVLNNNDASAGDACSDDFYLRDADFLALNSDEYRNMYTWRGEVVFIGVLSDYAKIYRNLNIANTSLDVLVNIPETPENRVEYRDIKGQGLFLRARVFHQAAQLWSPAYDEKKAATDLGIALRLDGDFNAPSSRSTLKETYDRILADLKESAASLPLYSLHPNRPGKLAAYAMLARVYLSMRRYAEANLYADSCLQKSAGLMDYNTLSTTANYPFAKYNTEVIFDARGVYSNIFSNGKVSPELYNLYSADDLRKALFFKSVATGVFAFRGGYQGNEAPYTGCTTDELYLIRAECLVRENNLGAGLKWLNDLAIKRYKTGKFVPYAATGQAQALSYVLAERRKELAFRNLRWSDLKRLNLEGANITLSRTVSGQTYTLAPNSPKYALPLPEEVITISGMPQNPQQ